MRYEQKSPEWHDDIDRRAKQLRESRMPVGMHLPEWENMSESMRHRWRLTVVDMDNEAMSQGATDADR